jgi:hypothetical protein
MRLDAELKGMDNSQQIAAIRRLRMTAAVLGCGGTRRIL